ncbi:MAG: hypothetical protein DMG16_03350 [Acidobacteria bacterium]|nr:MAG: hypothetical protein DMG16_03350 [Acidobacteriota bacterium]
MSAQNKALVRRWINAAYNKGDWKVLDEVLAPNFVRHDDASGVTGEGPDVEKQVATLYRTAFPDLHLKIEEMVAEGNTVAVRWTATGTATGKLRDIPLSGRKVVTPGLSICRISRGKITEHFVYWDTAAFNQQITRQSTQAAVAGAR